MNVELIDYTGNGSENPSDNAANLLIFAKSTRLEMKPGLLDDIRSWSEEKKLEEIKYIANTIPGSWEHVKYSFLVTDVTRAFSHQFVRSRVLSFSQQTMRILDVKGWEYGTGPTAEASNIYKNAMANVATAYDVMISDGVAIEDARGILPTNILTNIMATGSLRNFVELISKRSSSRTQGEYRDVLDGMKAEMLRVHPWTELFFERTFDKAAQELDEEIQALPDQDQRIRMIKLIDQMRSG